MTQDRVASVATPPAVRGDAVVLGYGRHLALGPSDFVLPTGGVTALIGPNGSGKSSLLAAVAGLLAPVAGALIRSSPVRPAYVLQSTEVSALLPITVREVVTMGRYADRGLLRPLRRADHAAVDEAIERMELGDLVHRHLRELSGGQRQRVFVAQGLAQQSDLLLLDEPVTGLDLVSRARIVDAIGAERAAGRTVLLSTHDLDDARLADHVLLLAGRVVAAGPPHEVLTPAHLSAAYGGRLLTVDGGVVLLDDAAHRHAAG